MLNIGIIGCGNWSRKVINEIENHQQFKFNSIVCRDKNKLFIKKKIKIIKSIDGLINNKSIDCIYVAAIPTINLEVVKLAKLKKIPLIVEKPVSENYTSSIKMRTIAKENNMVILPNISHIFSENFEHLNDLIKSNFTKIKEIKIYEGNNGPFRNNINPIWDWGFHSFSLLIHLFGYENMLNFSSKEIKNKKYPNLGIISRFNFTILPKIRVKIINGNLFKKKIRKIKIILEDKNVILANLSEQELFFKNKVVFRNNQTPVKSLLDKFYESIKNNDIELSQQLLDTTCKTTKILELFYKS